MSATKVCSTCNQRKRILDFPRRGQGKRRKQCKECHGTTQRKRRAEENNYVSGE